MFKQQINLFLRIFANVPKHFEKIHIPKELYQGHGINTYICLTFCEQNLHMHDATLIFCRCFEAAYQEVPMRLLHGDWGHEYQQTKQDRSGEQNNAKT